MSDVIDRTLEQNFAMLTSQLSKNQEEQFSALEQLGSMEVKLSAATQEYAGYFLSLAVLTILALSH